MGELVWSFTRAGTFDFAWSRPFEAGCRAKSRYVTNSLTLENSMKRLLTYAFISIAAWTSPYTLAA